MEQIKNNLAFVVEFDIYTDGDCGLDSNLLKNYQSKYFGRFFEHTEIDEEDYSYKFRRVFTANELRDAVRFLMALKESFRGDEWVVETMKKLFGEVVCGLERVLTGEKSSKIFPDWIDPDEATIWSPDFNYLLDGNVELHFRGHFTENCPRRIKQIIYEDEV